MGRLRNMKAEGVEPVIQIFNCESEELAFLFEEEAIAKYGRLDLGLGPLHNHTNGGEGTSGYKASPETRKKQSDAKKGENNPHKGKSPSPETRKKQSDVMKGRPSPLKGRPSQQKCKPPVTCPHCGKEGDVGAMKRWHFDNCKQKRDPKIPFD